MVQDGAERGCVRGLDTVLLACVARDWLCPCFSNESGELAHLFLMLLRSVSHGGLTWKKGMRPCVGEAVGREDWCCNREEVDADVQERFRAVGWTQAGSWRGQRVQSSFVHRKGMVVF